MMKNIDADYYGYRDEDDGILIPLEREVEKEGLHFACCSSLTGGRVRGSQAELNKGYLLFCIWVGLVLATCCGLVADGGLLRKPYIHSLSVVYIGLCC